MNTDVKISEKLCLKCGFLQHESHLRCLKCRNSKFQSVMASGNSELITYTTLTAVPAEFLKKKSYALGIVEFENGVRALGQIDSQKSLKVGMNLRTIPSTIYIDGKQIDTYRFEPINNEN